MSKITLEFETPEEREDAKVAINAHYYKMAFEDVWEKLFRPRHKHGYNDVELNSLLGDKNCNDLMDKLEAMYQDLRQELGENVGDV